MQASIPCGFFSVILLHLCDEVLLRRKVQLAGRRVHGGDAAAGRPLPHRLGGVLGPDQHLSRSAVQRSPEVPVHVELLRID